MIDSYPLTKENYYFVGQITPRTLEEMEGPHKPITMRSIVAGMRSIAYFPEELSNARKRAPEYDGTGQ